MSDACTRVGGNHTVDRLMLEGAAQFLADFAARWAFGKLQRRPLRHAGARSLGSAHAHPRLSRSGR